MLRYWPFKKDYLLALISLLLVVAGYELAFKRTLDARGVNVQLREQLAQQHSAADEPAYTERKNTNLNSVIGLYHADTISYRSDAINTIALIAEKNNVKLDGAPVQDKSYRTEKYLFQKLTFSGDFFSLLKLLYQLQGANGTGMLRSCTFRSRERRDAPAGNKTILLDVLFEVIVK
jgi:hypothetical protein